MAAAAALMAVLFLLATRYVFQWTYVTYTHWQDWQFVVASLITIVVSSIAVGLLMKWAGPLSIGSGIPQLKAQYWKDTGIMPLKAVLVKFAAGVLSIGGGASLGREGPTLFFGAGIASNIAGWFRTPRHLRRAPAALGATAGLAAAFNTPMAAITFVLEEILGDLSSRALGRMILASVVGAFVVAAVIGRNPAFLLPLIDHVSWWLYAILPVVAIATSLFGVVFQRSVLSLRGHVKRQKALPRWALPVVGGLATWGLGVTVYLTLHKVGVFGLGYIDLTQALNNHFLWWVAGIMVVAKLAATIFAYSYNGCGGIFSPLLFIGGMGGFFFAGLATFLGVPLTPADTMALAAMGMATCLGTVLRTPLSVLLIVFEMTHEFSVVPGLLLGLLLSTLVSRLSGDHNFYDALLVQDGHRIHQIHPPSDFHSWKTLAVSALATPHPVVLEFGQESAWQAVVAKHPYQAFPVVQDGVPQGVIFRRDVSAGRTAPEDKSLMPAVVCRTDALLEEVEARFLETPAGVILLVDTEGLLQGVVTLHDLLRAQAATRD